MPQAADTTTRRDEMPLAGRSMELREFRRADPQAAAADTPLATAQMVFAAGAAVLRYDYMRDRRYLEQLVIEPGAMRMERMNRGAPLLNTHSSWDLEDVLGVVDSPSVEAGQGVCNVSFSRRDSVAGYVQDVADGIIRNVSVGYRRHRIEMVPPSQEGMDWVYRVVDWEPYEVSLVPIPADMDCQVRSDRPAPQPGEQALRTFPCEFIETRSQPASPTVGVSAASSTGAIRMDEIEAGTGTQPAVNTQTFEQQRAAAEAAAATAAAQRASEVTELCVRHNVAHLAAGLIRGNQPIDQVRGAVLDELARRDAASGGHRNVRTETVRDEMQVRLAGIELAILHRVAPRTQLDDNGRQYRGMSLLEMGREFLEANGQNTRGLDRMQLATRMLTFRAPGMMTSGDFSSLFANVANKRLRNAYDENPGTYGIWARRAPNAPDFKNISVVNLSGAPDLLQTNEHGEFKYGTMTDGAESYAMVTYGRIVALTRQAIINDDLRSFDRLVSAFGNSARRLENRLVYAQLTANAALSDTIALFHASHGNLSSGGAAAISVTSLTAARTAMRVQKGLQSEELNIAPAYLIVPAALEQVAYQYTSSNYVPATPANVNEFRSGGRTALEPVVEPLLDASSATAWYLAASNGQIDTVEYAYLDGAEGPVIESEMGFEVDGISYKCRLDFAAKAVDYRGLNKNVGA